VPDSKCTKMMVFLIEQKPRNNSVPEQILPIAKVNPTQILSL
jgi:hypothetical protein